MKCPRVDELDGLRVRALLALWVVACHILSWCGYYDVRFPGHLGTLWWTFLGGSSAVDTFMILSGFAISFLLNSRPQAYLEFMTGRFFRLYPVYLVCLLLGLASLCCIPTILQTAPWKSTSYFWWVQFRYTSESTHLGQHILWHLTLLNGLLPTRLLHASAASLLSPAWSITLEWQYYLIAPFIARRIRSGTFAFALILLSIFGAQFAQAHYDMPAAFLPTELPLFLIGIGSYHLYAWFCREGLPHSSLYALPAAAFLAFGIFSEWHWAALSIWAMAFGSIFVRGNDFASTGFSLVRRLLLHPVLQQLGRMSYCIYLIHWPIIIFFVYLFLLWQPAISGLTLACILFVITPPLILCGSALLHQFIELPGMAFGKKLAAKKR
jgi:peptidoglycan/LPS O-acetylase OafA/YrhL